MRGRGEATEVKAQGRKEGATRAQRRLRGQRCFPHPGCSSLVSSEEGWPRAWAGGPGAQQVCAEWPTERPGALRGRPVS